MLAKFARCGIMKFLMRVAFFCLALPLAQAQETRVRRLSLEECMQLALEKNLDIRITRYLPDFARLNLQLDYAAYDPRFSAAASRRFSTFEQGSDTSQFQPPSQENTRETYSVGVIGNTPVGLRYNISGTMDRSRSSTEISNILYKTAFDYTPALGVTLAQPLLRDFWIDQTRWLIATDKKNIQRDQQSLRAQIITVAADVETAYYNLIAAREEVRVQQTAVELAQTSLAQNKKRVEVGAMAPLEEKQAESEVSVRSSDLLV